ncbi:MAG: NAD(P)/FAD-dependent oxidoreductase [Hyphomonadaceae bacterium]
MKDVIVVGGGVIGLFCAVRLRLSGARVTVLEAEGEHASYYGPAASAAAAGMLAPIADDLSMHAAVALESFGLWREFQRGAEWADGVRFDGGVVVRRDEAEARAFAQQAVRLGRRAAPLSAGDFRKRTGLRAKIEHALFVEDEGVCDPLRVLSGLAMQAHALGVLREYHSDVAAVTPTRAITHDDRVYEGDVVVLAPGAWATEKMAIAAPALRHVRPAKGHLTIVELDRSFSPNLRAPGFYLAQRKDEVVLGATMEFDRFDRRVEPAKVQDLISAAEALLPGEVRKGERAWAGIRPMSPDGWPLIGPTGDGVLAAIGHGREGWLLAPVTAEIIRAYVFGAEIPPRWAALSPARFDAQ